MPATSEERLNSVLNEYSKGVPGLRDELRNKVIVQLGGEDKLNEPGIENLLTRIVEPSGVAISPERIILGPDARPVMRIRDNKVTGEWVGKPTSDVWSKAIADAADVLNAALPAVGRIELTNSDLPWAGTGWLIDTNIIVTNRHVAEDFARPDGAGNFVFRRGLVSGTISSDVDFLEEENRADANEHPVDRVLLICDDYDVAFLSIRPAVGKGPLPRPIELADKVETDMAIAAIGYPARDPSIEDQELVKRVFGDVYEKKRLAPGTVTGVEDDILRHDCSTLGGNSGSVLIDFISGKAVGLHYGGYFDDSANLAVPAARLRELLDVARSRAAQSQPEAPSVARPASPVATAGASVDGQTLRFNLNVPIELVLRMGMPSLGGAAVSLANLTAVGTSLDDAVTAARQMLAGRDDILEVRRGYRFKNGWITDETVIVVVVRSKLDPAELAASGTPSLPREIMGFGVDVRTGSLIEQLRALDVDVAIERPAKPAGYREPKGYDDPGSRFALVPVKEKMDAIFHVSPDAGFPTLKAFLGRVRGTLTATMYEWEANNHVSKAIEAAIKPAGRALRMVTQKLGVRGSDATDSAVQDMKARLGAKFSHVWASVQGPDRLINSSYHIKVASRDGEEFWLSSGNWKDSNQPKIDPVADHTTSDEPLREYNREWHAVIANKRLAELFQAYIEYDFEQAKLHPLPTTEGPVLPDVELFVPEIAFERPRARGGIRYFEPLKLSNEELDVQPLLTPDRNSRGQRMFMAAILEAMQSATRKLYVQNQSFSYSGEDNQELMRMLELLRQKQRDGLDVRIIFRDAKDYNRVEDLKKQQDMIERLKNFGLKVTPDALRVQSNCHTKGVIVDSSLVILGSQNFTNAGALFNRDASLLVRSPKVARYYEEIFLHDWDNLAHNDVNERIGNVRRARPGEPTPPGYRRISLSELLGDDS